MSQFLFYFIQLAIRGRGLFLTWFRVVGLVPLLLLSFLMAFVLVFLPLSLAISIQLGSSSHLWFSLPILLLFPRGYQFIISCDQLPSFLLQRCPAQFHFKIHIIPTMSATPVLLLILVVFRNIMSLCWRAGGGFLI